MLAGENSIRSKSARHTGPSAAKRRKSWANLGGGSEGGGKGEGLEHSSLFGRLRPDSGRRHLPKGNHECLNFFFCTLGHLNDRDDVKWS